MQGLFLLVKPTGSRLWQMKYRFDGKEKLLSFGAYPSVTLASARRHRDQACALLATGEDPGVAKQEQKRIKREANGETFAKFAEAYVAKARKENKAPATISKTVWLLGLAKADLGSKPISDITSPAVLVCLRKVEAKGNYETAKRLRAVIGAVFRLAIATGATEIDPTLKQSRHAFDAMPEGSAIEKRNKALFAFLMITGARDGAVSSLRLKRIDLIEGCAHQDGRDVRTKFAKTSTTYFLPVDLVYLACFTDWVTFLRDNLLFGHDSALTTITSYLPVSQERQEELIRG